MEKQSYLQLLLVRVRPGCPKSIITIFLIYNNNSRMAETNLIASHDIFRFVLPLFFTNNTLPEVLHILVTLGNVSGIN